jgi:hypothetical protein
LTLLCGIHSRLALGVTSRSGWNSSQNHFTYFIARNHFRTSIETEVFHVLSSYWYSSPCVFETQRGANTTSQFSQGDIDLKQQV